MFIPFKLLQQLVCFLYDAIYQACTSRTLVQGEPVEPRRVIIVMGDGNDNASKKSLEEVLELAQRNLVTIYGISTTSYGFTSDGSDNLVRLAEETGGRVTYPLQDVYKDVSGYLGTPSDDGNYALKVGTGGYAAAISNSIFKSIADIAGEITTAVYSALHPRQPGTGPEEGFKDHHGKGRARQREGPGTEGILSFCSANILVRLRTISVSSHVRRDHACRALFRSHVGFGRRRS